MRLCLAAAAALLAMSGCGGSSDATQTKTVTVGHTEELSKSEWIAKADTICAQFEDEQKPLKDQFESQRQEPGESPAQLEALAATYRELLELVGDETAGLRRLEPPAADREVVEEMLRTVDASVPLGEQLADAIEDGDSSEIEEASQGLEASSARAEGLAQGYGLEVCGSGD